MSSFLSSFAAEQGTAHQDEKELDLLMGKPETADLSWQLIGEDLKQYSSPPVIYQGEWAFM